MSQASLFTSTHEQACKEFTMKGSVGKVRDALGFPPLQVEVEVELPTDDADDDDDDDDDGSLRPRIVCVQHAMSAVPLLVVPCQPPW